MAQQQHVSQQETKVVATTTDIFRLFFCGGRPHSTHKHSSRHWSGKWQRETPVEKEVEEK